MLTQLTLVLIVHYAGFLIFGKKRSNRLACGLFGWVGEDPKQFNKDKFDKLGMYNVERGKHSCGVAVDGTVYKGIGNTASYQDFIIDDHYPSPEKVPVVIAHTRQASVGVRSLDNTHPFKIEFDKDDGTTDYVLGAHNGTLKNHREIAIKYGIEDGLIKIDSHILIETIAKGNHQVLEEYRGGAALLIYSSKKPDTIYVFRGESAAHNYSTTPVEERPLFFYQESENSMYISSLADSLKSIVNSKEEKEDSIFQFKTNKLYEITKGKITHRFKIDRSKCWEGFSTPSVNRTHAPAPNRPGFRDKTKDTDNTASVGGATPSNRSSIVDAEKTNNIYYEKIIHNNLDQDIYYENLLYKRNGHTVTSICVFIEEVGFIRIGDNIRTVMTALKDFAYYDKDIESDIQLGDISDTTLYYIVDGVLLKTKFDYAACTEGAFKNPTQVQLSNMSQYPVIDLIKLKKAKKQIVSKHNQNILLCNSLYSGDFEPLGMNVKYSFRNGKMESKEILDDINMPSGENSKLSLYESIGDVENDEDADVFEESLTAELLNQSDNELIDCVFEVAEEYESANSSLMMLEEHKGSSVLVNMLLEFGENTKKSFEPIALGIQELMDIKKSKS